MFRITHEMIKDLCSNSAVYNKARRYYNNGSVTGLHFDYENYLFEARVAGSSLYNIEVKFDNGEFYDASCTCPAYSNYFGYCKHIGAVLFQIKDLDAKGELRKPKQEDKINEIIDFFRYKDESAKETLDLEITFEYNTSLYTWGEVVAALSLRIGTERLYKVKSPEKLLEAIADNDELYFGKKFTYEPHKHVFKDRDRPIIDFLLEIYENEQIMKKFSVSYATRKSLFIDNRVCLGPTALKRFFKHAEDLKLKANIFGREYENVKILERDIPIDFSLTKSKDDIVLKINSQEGLIPLTDKGEYFFLMGDVYKVSESQRKNLLPFYSIFEGEKVDKVTVPKEYRETFLSEIYPRIQDIGEINIDNELESSIYKPELRPEVYLDKEEESVTADIKFIYDEITIKPFDNEKDSQRIKDKILLRDMDRENKIINIFENAEFKVRNKKVYLDNDEHILSFILSDILKLQEIAEIFYSEDFKNIKVRDSASFSGGVRLNKDNDLLEFTFDIEGINKDELTDIFDLIRQRKKYYKLKDGSYLPLEAERFDFIINLMEGLDLDEEDLTKDIIELPKFRAMYLDEYVKESELQSIKRDLKFKELVQNIREPQDLDFNIPPEVKDTLRGYQSFGYKWLKTLSSYGLSGILADDMGLGKTIQMLTYLLSEKREKGIEPSLIVAPTSLVYNWLEEIEKFTPDLKAIIISGPKEKRREDIETIGDYDVVITSYPLIRNDIEFYEDMNFRCCILDEAQHIKNPLSQSAKSVKKIKSKNNFALTGTPIENSLTELWSIFDFVMPGYLLSHKKFKNKFENPIIKDKNGEALNNLRKHIKPFILRRLKKNVLKELPDKIENKVVAELSEEQKKIYLAYMQQIKGEVAAEIKEKGFGRSHIKILSALTRLRQICCDPATFIDGYSGGSGKLLLLEEILEDAIASGHRILLFSQFTSMLSIIKEMLDKKKIEYKYLDGSTPTKDRGKLVKEFNNGAGDVFLISLKAGGTGLNLTGADMVIHYDPWWNPAVEEQATDRAYRIGQKNAVHVMKLITKGTIEEKIYKLQERKRKIFDDVIKPGQTLVSKLSEEEIKDLFEI